MSSDVQIEKKYWDEYYKEKVTVDIPSQFSVFVANECRDSSVVIDIGCGNGRDTFFFKSMGFNVIGVDSSASAIDICDKKNRESLGGDGKFFVSDVESLDLFNKLKNAINDFKSFNSIIIYSRFFLHAINESQENHFINLLSNLLTEFSGSVALEFRTQRDEQQKKVTAAHYRRFVDPVKFFSKIEKSGFDVDYFAEGFGFAKYKQDDAHVARFILKKST
jgi:ubiquinone/menaquinone biosynthesis C-methylase UbiE